MSAKYKSPSFLLPNELNTSANTANDTGINSLYSMNFDGSNYIDTGFVPANNLTLNCSISAWVNMPAISNNASSSILGTYEFTNGRSRFFLRITRTSNIYKYFFGLGSGTGYIQDSSVTISNFSPNTWVHLALTYDGADVKLYSNGTLDGTLNAGNVGSYPPLNANFSGNTYIGATHRTVNTTDPTSAVEASLTGQIDEVAIFNRALTDGTGNTVNEIAALYEGTSPNIYPSNLMATNLNPIAYYPLGEQAQNSGYPGSSTPANNVWQFPNGVLQDYVMDFDGSASSAADFINTSNTLIGNIGSNPHTFSAWINISDHGQVQTILSNKNSNGWKFEVSSGASPDNITFYISGTNLLRATFPSSSYGSWINAVAVINGSSSKIYINGVDQSASVTGTLIPPDSTEPLIIGAQDNGSGTYIRSLNGQMSNVQIFNSALPETGSNSVETLYNNGSPLTSMSGFTSLTNWWKLNADSVYTPSVSKYPTALEFSNAAQSEINTGVISSLNNASAFTVSFWMLRTATHGSSTPFFFGNRDTSNSYRGIAFSMGRDTPSQRIHGFYVYNVTGGYSFYEFPADYFRELNTWHHIVLTWDSSRTPNNFIGYWNGSNAVSQNDTTATQVPSTGNFFIGADSTSTHFSGQMSNFAIYNSALTADQVSTLFNFGTPEVNTSFSPTHNWKLDNLTTGLNDVGSLASNNGSNTAAVEVNSNVATIPSWKIPSALPIPTVNYTTALDFDGNDYISMSGVTLSDDFAFSFWFYTTSSSSLMFFFGDSASFNWCRINNGVFDVKFNGLQLTDNPSPAANPTFTIPANQWNNVILVKDSNSLIQVYFNGQVDPNYTPKGVGAPNANPNQPFSPVFIGRRMSSYFTGKLSNVSMWNSALTALQVSTIYNNGSPEVTLSFSPAHWWKLNEGGSTIIDNAGSSNGTNNGATKVDSSVYVGNVPVNGVSTTLPSTALQQSDLQFDSPYSNYSLSFDGSADYVDIVNSSTAPTSFQGLGNSNSYSISSWINTTTTDTYSALWFAGKTILEMRNEGTTGIHVPFNLSVSSGKLFFGRSSNYTTSSENYSSTTSINTGSWVHCIATVDNNTLKFYINGSLDSTHTFTTATGDCSVGSNTSNFFIGSRSTDAGGNDAYFNGKIDETAIWNTALTEAQVLEIYNNGKPGDLDNFSGTAPISWWRLGENAYFDNNSFVVPNSIAGAPNGIGSGTVTSMLSADAPGTYANGIGDGLAITDRVGDAPLSVANSQSYNMIPDDKVLYVPGYIGAQIANTYSMTFDGNDDYFDSNFIPANNINTNFTISAWVNVGSFAAGGIQSIINTEDYAGSQSRFSFRIYNDGAACANCNVANIKYYIAFGNTHNQIRSSISNFSNNTWVHLALTYDGTDIKMYSNSTLDDTYNAGSIGPLPPIGTYNGHAFIGAGQDSRTGNPPRHFLNGSIDEVAIFDKALTADQIKFDLYEPTTTGKTADIENNTNLPTPVAWYRMGD